MIGESKLINLFEEIIGDSVIIPERNPIIDLDFSSERIHVDLHFFYLLVFRFPSAEMIDGFNEVRSTSSATPRVI